MKKVITVLVMVILMVGCGDETTIRGYTDEDVQNMLIFFRDSINSTDTIVLVSNDTIIKITENDSIYSKLKDSLYGQIVDSVIKKINVDSILQVVVSAVNEKNVESSSSANLYEYELKKKAGWKQFNSNITYGEFEDKRDNQKYKTVKIGNYTWMAENLNYADSVVFQSLKGGNSECYDNYEGNCILYGRLYSRRAILDSLRTNLCDNKCSIVNKELPFQGICPDGWHLPDTTEFLDLLNAAGEVIRDTTNNLAKLSDASGLLSECSWINELGTNSTGFSLLAGGMTECYDGTYGASHACFREIGKSTSFWILNYTFGIEINNFSTERIGITYLYSPRKLGSLPNSNFTTRHVRCVKDAE